MAKVYGIHVLELNPGVTGEEYEQFMAGEGAALLQAFPGVKLYILKGDRGARAGQYAALWEFDSVEVRDQMFPRVDGPWAETVGQFLHPLARLSEKAATLTTEASGPATYTDYVVVAE
jgi:hypothetical protein